ncbi:chitin disaccharide deacetylase [Sutcliffiella horikoshii]|uniref:Carbohydrate deacetylase n=1 Tax=Sutcliffiella horikoshii TaxID=79883 RepID=A0A5D4T0C4_9BACI|nr:chitin disaccharide deacetylase [Sutcliffiella horikoshii]TYS67556.1 chitin disaccharide deacetylase [Sutcliffiella horikoshii]
MIRLIVNADDFGLCQGVNYGILDSHLYGIVTSTTMMMNMPGTEHAIELAKAHPALGVGIHLVLTGGYPINQDVPSLVDEKGAFLRLSAVNSNTGEIPWKLKEVEREWDAQIKKFLASGLHPTHLDSHHHVHTLPQLLPVIQKLAKQYNLPVRANGLFTLPKIKSFTDICLLDFYGDSIEPNYFERLPHYVADETTVEVMCHPAYLDSFLLENSSYHVQRVKELDILINSDIPDGVVLG